MSRPAIYFFFFAILIVARDVVFDLALAHHVEARVYALIVTAFIAVCGGVATCRAGRLQYVLRACARRQVTWRVGVLGVAAAGVYAVTFFAIARVGAGLFNVIDYGLAPILTALIGMMFYRERLSGRHAVAGALYTIGVLLLEPRTSFDGLALLGIAMLSPLLTASSDGITKWLLSPSGGGLHPSELLLVRFAPACGCLLFLLVLYPPETWVLGRPVAIVSTAIFLGVLPLWLLTTGLVRGALTELAAWELLIPLGAFLATLPAHADRVPGLLPFLGATTILVALVLCTLPHGAGSRTEKGGHRG